MDYEREYDPQELLAGNDGNYTLTLPAAFIQKLSEAQSLQTVLNTFAEWINVLFYADRVSLTIKADTQQLELYSLSGNQAIPLNFMVPVDNSFVGRAYKNKKLMICDDLSKSHEIDCRMLSENGLQTCMDAPLLVANTCIGTLNVGHAGEHHYTEMQAVKLQCLANWIALNISLHLQIMEMQKIASTDYLTDIPNRREFNKFIYEKMHAYKNDKQVFYFGIMDVDRFKQLNDKYGHDAGDVVLKEISKQIVNTIPQSYFFARIGGEEFALITSSDLSSSSASNFYNAIRELISEIVIHYYNETITFTASIGFTAISDSDKHVDDIYTRADKALYCAKNTGRNKVEFLSCQ